MFHLQCSRKLTYTYTFTNVKPANDAFVREVCIRVAIFCRVLSVIAFREGRY